MSEGSTGNGSASKGEKSSATQVQIPGYLQPLFRQGAGVAGGALSEVQRLAGQDLTAPFNADQNAAFQQARDVAGGAGGFIPEFQQLLQDTAGGRSVQSFLDPTAYNALSSSAGGTGFGSSLPPEVLAALQASAGGSNLYGGQGFNEAVQASVQQALPGISSAFGGTRGGLSGSSARQAVGDTAVNTFASQYAQERQNQLNASGLLANVGESERDSRLRSAGLLGQFGNDERGRQEQAGRDLPGAGLLPSNILNQIGGQQQEQRQRQLRAPLDQQLQLWAAALGLDLNDLLGESTDQDFSQVTLGFG